MSAIIKISCGLEFDIDRTCMYICNKIIVIEKFDVDK